jgi:hypothetical protein
MSCRVKDAAIGEEKLNMNKTVQALLVATALAFLPGSAAFAVDSAAALKLLDPDDDGTIDLKEAQAGAAACSRRSTLTTTARSTRRSSRAG